MCESNKKEIRSENHANWRVKDTQRERDREWWDVLEIDEREKIDMKVLQNSSFSVNECQK